MQAINFLLDFFFDAFLMVLIIRVWLQLVRADFYNPLSQFVVKITNPVVIPFRRVIPGLGGIDLATLLIAYIVAVSKFIVLSLVNGGPIDIVPSLLIGIIFLIKKTGFLMFILMLVMAIMSWVVQGYNPTMALLHQLTEPLLRPIRKVIPPVGGLDLSIIAAFLLLNVINFVLADIIPYWRML